MKTKAVIQSSLFFVTSSGTILQKAMLCIFVGILHLDVSSLCLLEWHNSTELFYFCSVSWQTFNHDHILVNILLFFFFNESSSFKVYSTLSSTETFTIVIQCSHETFYVLSINYQKLFPVVISFRGLLKIPEWHLENNLEKL